MYREYHQTTHIYISIVLCFYITRFIFLIPNIVLLAFRFSSTGLVQQCQLREERNYDYKKLTKIDDVPGIKPNGYLVKLPVYILSARDAHIVFAATESPNWTRDYVYEICRCYM